MRRPYGKLSATTPRRGDPFSLRSRFHCLLVALGVCGLELTASAAAPGGMGGPMGPGAPGGGMGGQPPGGGRGEEKKEGPAEEAPEDKEALRPIEPVPAQPRRLRRVQLFDLHGYLRLRGDYFHRLNMDL